MMIGLPWWADSVFHFAEVVAVAVVAWIPPFDLRQ
jgi:hypothetical protein